MCAQDNVHTDCATSMHIPKNDLVEFNSKHNKQPIGPYSNVYENILNEKDSNENINLKMGINTRSKREGGSGKKSKEPDSDFI